LKTYKFKTPQFIVTKHTKVSLYNVEKTNWDVLQEEQERRKVKDIEKRAHPKFARGKSWRRS
jgi:hypothetical protein